jgi:hypothetical protein
MAAAIMIFLFRRDTALAKPTVKMYFADNGNGLGFTTKLDQLFFSIRPDNRKKAYPFAGFAVGGHLCDPLQGMGFTGGDYRTINHMTYMDEARPMLAELGPGKRMGTRYDTAWLARTIEYDRELGGQAMDWLSMNQLPDGSWGAASPLYYHDHVVCTLAAMIALHRHGKRARDQRQIERGLIALTRLVRGATKGLTSDPQGATVGFEFIAPTLVAEAESRNLLQDQGGRILGRMAGQRGTFIATVQPGSIRRESSFAFMAEMAGEDQRQLLAVDTLQEANGSVACSPSATAYFATHIRPGDPAAVASLRRAAPQSFAPHRMPCEIQERVGAL